MDVERQCPACGNGQGLARRVSTVAKQKDIVIVVMVCEACSHEWRTERSSPTPDGLTRPEPAKLH
jgi:C4-type Zn-finger protein